jgi:hypothetical protein
MTACALCPHYESEHDRIDHRCRARYYWGPNVTLGQYYETCDCPGFEPEEDDDEYLEGVARMRHALDNGNRTYLDDVCQEFGADDA